MVFERPRKPASSHSSSYRFPAILLVDGDNIISLWPDLQKTRDTAGLESARSELIEALVSYSSFQGYETKIIFNALNEEESKNKKIITELLSVHYTEFAENKDSYIEKICQSLQTELTQGLISRLMVATSDKSLQLLVKRYSAECVSAQEFHGDVELTIFRLRHKYQARKQSKSRFLANAMDAKARLKLAELRIGLSDIQQTNIYSSSSSQHLASQSEKGNIQFTSNDISEEQQIGLPLSTNDSQNENQTKFSFSPMQKPIKINQEKSQISNALNAVNIGNFKAFSNTQNIKIRPLTLIFGANSSGKSSILHSLLLAHHAIKNDGELDIYRTEAGGESVDLGGFRQYVHKHAPSGQVELSVELDASQLNLADQGLKDLLDLIKTLTVGVEIGNEAGSGRVRVLSFSVEADAIKLLKMSYLPGEKLKLNYLNCQHPIINHLIDAIIETNTFSTQVDPKIRHQVEQIINELVPEITAQVFRLFPTTIQIGDNDITSNPNNQAIQGKTSLANSVRLILPYILNELIATIADTVERDFGRLRYLGPFRTYPPRHFAFSRQQDTNWYAGGGYAWDILLNNSEVRQNVNAWLGDSDRMKTPYELRVRKLVSDSQLVNELYPLISDSFERLAGQLISQFYSGSMYDDYEKLEQIAWSNSDVDIKELISPFTEPDTLAESWVKEIISRGEQISDLLLMDKRTNTPVSHRDVGIGVSQVIPILVSCYGLSDALVAIEQPEIHLHPKLQAELGDVFIESALGEQKNTFILETHSEHLLLRIMRRMRETYNNELPEGGLPVRPEDVSVLFVESDSRGSFVREMPLNKRGELVKAWPGGFFEEELDEIF